MASFEYYREYYRVAATLYATDEGLFKEVPEDLASASIGIEVVYRICFYTEGGEIKIMDCTNPPAKDKDRAEGGPVTVDGDEWYVEEGEGTTELALTTRFSPHLSEGDTLKLAQMHSIAKSKEGFLP